LKPEAPKELTGKLFVIKMILNIDEPVEKGGPMAVDVSTGFSRVLY